jgi:hypothetical protein
MKVEIHANGKIGLKLTPEDAIDYESLKALASRPISVSTDYVSDSMRSVTLEVERTLEGGR